MPEAVDHDNLGEESVIARQYTYVVQQSDVDKDILAGYMELHRHAALHDRE
jgi:hypothetical protein